MTSKFHNFQILKFPNNTKLKKALFITLGFCCFYGLHAQTARPVWPKYAAIRWYARQGWLRGCDFIPSTAVNQLEMWQSETFDPATITRELGYAQSIGFNCMRVFL